MSEVSFPLAVVGLCHKQNPLEIKELAALRLHRHFHNRESSRPWPTVLLSTCNRCEVYGPLENLKEWRAEIQSLFTETSHEAIFYQKTSWECFHHLSRVATGLESAFFGETQIPHQIKTAYEKACEQELHSCHHFAFQKAIRVSKKIREKLCLDGSHASLETLLWQSIKPHDSLLFVGASHMNEDIINSFLLRGASNITLANRTLSSRAIKILENKNIKNISWNQLDSWTQFDHVFIATTSLTILPAFDEKMVLGIKEKPLSCQSVFDLSLPCNASTAIKELGVALLNIEDLKRKVRDKSESFEKTRELCEKLILEECQRHEKRWQLKMEYQNQLLLV